LKSGRLIIVGGGMACHRLCHTLLQHGYDTSKIEIYSEESIPPYDRANLSKNIGKGTSRAPLLSQPQWYQKHGIQLHLSQRIQGLDTDKKCLYLEDDRSVPFTNLVLALGAKPASPNIEGIGLDRVFTYRSWNDLLKIKSLCGAGSRIAVIGGGLLGLEAAAALHVAKCDVTVFEMANALLCHNLNEEASQVLQEALRELGIQVSLKSTLKKIHPESGCLKLLFHDDTQHEFDGVIVATGHRPVDEMAATSGIAVSPKGGIMIDEHLKTNHENIYAMGDCTSFQHSHFGVVQAAYEQADVLAARLSGIDQTYKPTGRYFRLNIVGIEISTYGENLGDGEHLVFNDASAFRSLVLQRGKLMGATTIGSWEHATALRIAVQENLNVPHRQKKAFPSNGDLQLLTDMGGVASWPDDSVICNCCHVTCGTIRHDIKGGLNTLTKLEKQCGAGGQCGSCRSLLLGLIHPKAHSQQNPTRRSDIIGKTFKWAAILALLGGLIFWAPWNVPAPESVETGIYQISRLWNDDFIKQITGYGTAGLSLFSLIYSLRKRIKWFHFGEMPLWKTMHASLGTLTLLTLFLHTGLSMGHNLNFWLAANFISLNTLGALAALSMHAADTSTNPLKHRFRLWLARSHLVFFWPYPVLLGVHIYKVYQY
jgi:nitrite reductase (NADH) large subunit